MFVLSVVMETIVSKVCLTLANCPAYDMCGSCDHDVGHVTMCVDHVTMCVDYGPLVTILIYFNRK